MMEYNWEDKNILVVDDTKMNFVLLKNQLRKTMANIFWIENGYEAIEYVKKENKVDLILMDVRMPIIDGIEASRQIKELKPEIPIIIQTASVMGDTFDDIASSNCDDTIFKPIDAKKLLDIIAKQFIKNSQK